ncbi:DUF6531 domain-containing protein, partial [Streptomyces anulatus]|uniref:DUF6531 domain-containing protein n=1 Tax=Streptomyces anulatus TaxID=1892 RepID=UPI00342FE34F
MKTDATITAVEAEGWGTGAEPPKDAVPREERFIDQNTTGDQGKPSAKNAKTAGGSPLAALLAGEPALLDAFPRNGMLVESLTPTLRGQGKVTSGSGPLRYAFKVCDTSSMAGTGCTSSGTLSSGISTWKVPANKLAWGKQYWWQVTITDTSNSMSTVETRTFVTGVRQPVLTSQLAGAGVNGQEFNQLAGNYTTTFTDLSVPSAGPPLSVGRTYNSMDPRIDGIFGAGW